MRGQSQPRRPAKASQRQHGAARPSVIMGDDNHTTTTCGNPRCSGIVTVQPAGVSMLITRRLQAGQRADPGHWALWCVKCRTKWEAVVDHHDMDQAA